MICLGLGTKTTWLRLGKDIGGVSCTEVKWFVVKWCLILQLDPPLICRPLEMHLSVSWQLGECLLCVERALGNINWHTVDMQLSVNRRIVKTKCYQKPQGKKTQRLSCTLSNLSQNLCSWTIYECNLRGQTQEVVTLRTVSLLFFQHRIQNQNNKLLFTFFRRCCLHSAWLVPVLL